MAMLRPAQKKPQRRRHYSSLGSLHNSMIFPLESLCLAPVQDPASFPVTARLRFKKSGLFPFSLQEACAAAEQNT